jgi:hypothetical protein
MNITSIVDGLFICTVSPRPEHAPEVGANVLVNFINAVVFYV